MNRRFLAIFGSLLLVTACASEPEVGTASPLKVDLDAVTAAGVVTPVDGLTAAGNAVACMREGLLPNNQKALTVLGFVAYHDYESVALNLEERERIVADLGDKRILILRNHGLLTVGETIGEAFTFMARIETACQYQVDILSCGRPLRELSKETQDLVIQQGLDIFSSNRKQKFARQWDAMLRKLEREKGTGWRH